MVNEISPLNCVDYFFLLFCFKKDSQLYALKSNQNLLLERAMDAIIQFSRGISASALPVT